MSKLNKWAMNYAMGLRPLYICKSFSNVGIDFRRRNYILIKYTCVDLSLSCTLRKMFYFTISFIRWLIIPVKNLTKDSGMMSSFRIRQTQHVETCFVTFVSPLTPGVSHDEHGSPGHCDSVCRVTLRVQRLEIHPFCTRMFKYREVTKWVCVFRTANISNLNNVDLMLAHRLRRWVNITPTLSFICWALLV